MTPKQKMIAGELYRADDPEIAADHMAALAWTERYNAAAAQPAEARLALLREGLGAAGEGTVVRPPFRVDYGFNVRLGAGVFVNFGCVILDVCAVTVGDGTQIGANVQLIAADHPRDPALRREGWENGRTVVIGRNVWIGSGALILPGVTVGDDAIVGAGAVVTRDVAAGATVVGNPARAVEPR